MQVTRCWWWGGHRQCNRHIWKMTNDKWVQRSDSMFPLAYHHKWALIVVSYKPTSRRGAADRQQWCRFGFAGFDWRLLKVFKATRSHLTDAAAEVLIRNHGDTACQTISIHFHTCLAAHGPEPLCINEPGMGALKGWTDPLCLFSNTVRKVLEID